MTSWTDRVNLETETISVDGGEATFTEWWDQLVGMTSRLIDLFAAQCALDTQRDEFAERAQERTPAEYTSPAQFFAYQKRINEARAGRDRANGALLAVNNEIDELVGSIKTFTANSVGLFRLRIAGREYLLRIYTDGFGRNRLTVDVVPQAEAVA